MNQLQAPTSVTLTPRGWYPNSEMTGGNFPPSQLIIPHDLWVRLGRPQNIEEFNAANVKLCTCHPMGCPVHGFMGGVNLGIPTVQP